MLGKRLYQYSQSGVYPFHMPGHKRREIMANPFLMDITEIEGFDNLHHATGILKEGQGQAARLYGSKRAYYLVNGSSCGILAAISAAVPRGGRILVARNSHRSVYNGIYLRQLSPEYVYPRVTKFGLQGQVTAGQIEEILEKNLELKAVLVTSPTYDGVVSDIKKIAEVVHRHDIPLIVDEAHGAHFGFHPSFPENATKLGADLVIMSTHKTLPAFTQTALLHVCSERVDLDRIERYLSIYETSSPSYILMAGINRCICTVEKDGKFYFQEYEKNLNAFYEMVSDLKQLHVVTRKNFLKEEAYDFDIGKLLVITGGYVTGTILQEQLLHRYKLQMEMAGGNYVTAMTSVMDELEGFERFSQALHELDDGLAGKEQSPVFSPGDIYRKPQKVMEPYEAEEVEQEEIPLQEACGKISAAEITLYPPGIPVLVPGERLDETFVNALGQCIKHGLSVEGPSFKNHVEQMRIKIVKT